MQVTGALKIELLFFYERDGTYVGRGKGEKEGKHSNGCLPFRLAKLICTANFQLVN